MTTIDHNNYLQKTDPLGENDKSLATLTCSCGELFDDSLKFLAHTKMCKSYEITNKATDLLSAQATPQMNLDSFQALFASNFDLLKSSTMGNNTQLAGSTGPITCIECNQVMSHDFHLIQHCHVEHNKFGSFTCQSCEEEFGNLSKYLLHKMIYNQCTGAGGQRASTLVDLKCHLCGMGSFKNHSEFLFHLNNCPTSNRKSPSPANSPSQLLASAGHQEQEILRRASLILNHHNKLQEPTSGSIHTTPNASHSQGNNSNHNSNSAAVSDVARPFRCEHCVKSFKSKALLDQHMHIHFPPKYTCRYCAKKYRWPPVFYHHQRTCKKRLQPPQQQNGNQILHNDSKHHRMVGHEGSKMRQRNHGASSVNAAPLGGNNHRSNSPANLIQQLQSQGIIPPPAVNNQMFLKNALDQLKTMPCNNNNNNISNQNLPPSNNNLMSLLMTAAAMGMKFPPFLPPPSTFQSPHEAPSQQQPKNQSSSPFNQFLQKPNSKFAQTNVAEETKRKSCLNCKLKFDDISAYLIHLTTCRPKNVDFETSTPQNHPPKTSPPAMYTNPFLNMLSAFTRQQQSTVNHNIDDVLASFNPSNFLNQIEENRRLLESQNPSTNNSSSSSCGEPIGKSPPKTPEYIDDNFFNAISEANGQMVPCQFCDKELPNKEAFISHFEGCHSALFRYKCNSCGKRYRWGASYSYHKKLCPDFPFISPNIIPSPTAAVTAPATSNNFSADNLANMDYSENDHSKQNKEESSSDPEIDQNSYDEMDFESPMKK